MTTEQQAPSTLFPTIALSMLAGLGVFILLSLLSSDGPKQNDATLTPEAVVNYVAEDMPESHLRSNLLIAFGAEYNGDSQELSELLRTYAEMKLKQMKNGL